jgi:hypothetical protein
MSSRPVRRRRMISALRVGCSPVLFAETTDEARLPESDSSLRPPREGFDRVGVEVAPGIADRIDADRTAETPTRTSAITRLPRTAHADNFPLLAKLLGEGVMQGKTRLIATVVAMIVGAGALRAQSVPLISSDLTLGPGTAGASAGVLDFRSTIRLIVAADVAIRFGGPGHLRPVLEVGYTSDVFAGRGDYMTICLPVPFGSCQTVFPRPIGPSIGIGARFAPIDRWMVGITAGLASFDRHARYAKLDASWRVIEHIAIVTTYRYLDVEAGGARAWFRPWTFGVRVN